MPSKSFTVQSAGHTGFTVSSIPQALKFWRDLLQCSVIYEGKVDPSQGPNPAGIHDAELNFVLVQLPGGHQVELIEFSAPGYRQVYKPRSCDVGSVHLALYVENSQALLDAAKDIGWTPLAGNEPLSRSAPDGRPIKISYLHGPDGESVELIEGIVG